MKCATRAVIALAALVFVRSSHEEPQTAAIVDSFYHLVARADTANCQEFSDSELDASTCRHEDRHGPGQPSDFFDLLTLMEDAHHQEGKNDFVYYVLTTMFEYVHCSSELHAIAHLVYNVSMDNMPPDESAWWDDTFNLLHPTQSSQGPGLVGRRRRALYEPDRVYLQHKIRNITVEAGPACVQWLIEKFLPTYKDTFHLDNPNFPDPNDHTPPPPTTTTTAPLSTTPRSTVPSMGSSPVDSAQSSPVPSSQSSTMATSQSSTMPPSPVDCAVCSGMQCLLLSKDELLKPCAGGRCLVQMEESGHSGRLIQRSCATVEQCKTLTGQNVAECADVEMKELNWGTKCSFCCNQSKCNLPPTIVPQYGRQ